MRKYNYFLIPISIVILSFGCSKGNGAKPDNRDTTIYVPGGDKPSSYNTTDEILKDYKLAWKDEFDGDKLDLKKWNYRYEGSVRNYATVSREVVSLDGKGHLVLKNTKDDKGKYYMGMLSTQNHYETTYGYFETRVQLNKQKSPQYAFWLQSPTYGKEGTPANIGIEIDVFEYVYKNPETIYHTLHWDGYGTDHKKEGTSVKISGLDEGFHTFGLLWTKDGYAFYVDGKRTWKTDKAVSQRDEYMIISNGITGWGGNPDLDHFPDSALYDYVRVYKPK